MLFWDDEEGAICKAPKSGVVRYWKGLLPVAKSPWRCRPGKGTVQGAEFNTAVVIPLRCCDLCRRMGFWT